MNVDAVKIELIDWIAKLNDYGSISKILSLKKKLSTPVVTSDEIFGTGKHLIESIDDSFNDPIDDFSDYQQ